MQKYFGKGWAISWWIAEHGYALFLLATANIPSDKINRFCPNLNLAESKPVNALFAWWHNQAQRSADLEKAEKWLCHAWWGLGKIRVIIWNDLYFRKSADSQLGSYAWNDWKAKEDRAFPKSFGWLGSGSPTWTRSLVAAIFESFHLLYTIGIVCQKKRLYWRG